jgi:hypothetical protein
VSEPSARSGFVRKRKTSDWCAGAAAVASGALPLLWLGFEPAPDHRHVLGARVIGGHGEALGVTRAISSISA